MNTTNSFTRTNIVAEESTKEHKFWQFSYKDYPKDPGLKAEDGSDLPRPFTKSQMKKWLKKVKWENRKAEKRARERLKTKIRKIDAKKGLIELGPSRKSLKRMKSVQEHSNISVIIDLSFDKLMIEKDRFKLIKQILRSYSINRRSLNPLKFLLTSFCGRFQSEISRHNGYEHWDVKFIENSYLEVFDKKKLIYLTSESENIIEQFEPDYYYIIGGLVDHNEHKGICYKKACDEGISHAKLPLEKYVNMLTRKVLTVDHVFEIILRVSEGMSWPETLLKVLPERKGAVVVDSRQDSLPRDSEKPFSELESSL